jgi:hypothetical protein
MGRSIHEHSNDILGESGRARGGGGRHRKVIESTEMKKQSGLCLGLLFCGMTHVMKPDISRKELLLGIGLVEVPSGLVVHLGELGMTAQIGRMALCEREVINSIESRSN